MINIEITSNWFKFNKNRKIKVISIIFNFNFTRGEVFDVIVSEHIDRECKLDPSDVFFFLI